MLARIHEAAPGPDAITVLTNQEPFFCQLDQALHKSGINVANLHVELDPGQVEMTCQPKFGMQTLDDAFIVREAVNAVLIPALI